MQVGGQIRKQTKLKIDIQERAKKKRILNSKTIKLHLFCKGYFIGKSRQQLFFQTTCRWSDIFSGKPWKEKSNQTKAWLIQLLLTFASVSLQTLYRYRGQCIFTALCLSDSLHENCLPHSTYVPNVKFCLHFSPSVAEGLITQPNCLDPSPRRDPSSPSIPSGISWTTVCIWLMNHLQLQPFIHQTVSRTILSPFEFSACPCCSLQM